MNIDKQDTEAFIHRVFDLYNGAINIFNRARLIIDWGLHMDTSSGGISMNPNTVYIYPKVIYRYFSDPYWFKFNLMVATIHELFHTDQIINYHRMMHDDAYRAQIEYTVEIETYLYIASHKYEIWNNLGLPSYVQDGQLYQALQIAGFEHGYLYHRRDWYSHIKGIFLDMMNESNTNQTIENIMSIMNDPRSKIDIILASYDVGFHFKDGPSFIGLHGFNDIMYDHFFKYTMRGSRISITRSTADNYTVNIKTKCSNILYNVVPTIPSQEAV